MTKFKIQTSSKSLPCSALCVAVLLGWSKVGQLIISFNDEFGAGARPRGRLYPLFG